MTETRTGTPTPEDGNAIVALLTANALPPDGVLQHLHTAVIARQGPRIVGVAALEVYEDGALLRSVAVAEDVKNQGVGRAVVEAALRLADRLDVGPVFLLTTTAEGYFPRYGFSVVTRREVPPGVLQSIEFRALCPASSTVMRRPGPARGRVPALAAGGGC